MKTAPDSQTLLFPSANGDWEVWALELGGAQLLRTEREPAIPRQSLLAIPARELFAVPLWLSTTDRSVMREMIFMQLERRGAVTSRGSEAVFDYRVVTQQGNRTLVLAIVLQGTLAAVPEGDFDGYAPSVDYLEFPPDAATLWREHGRLVIAMTRGEIPAYVQTLGSGELTPAVLRELRCILLQLKSDNIVLQSGRVHLRGEFTPADVTAIANTLGIGTEIFSRPTPLMPETSLDITPFPIRMARTAALKRGRRLAVAKVVGGFYLLVLSLLLMSVGRYWIEGARLEAGLRKDRNQVEELRAVSARWDRLTAVVDTDTYPMELLLQCSSRLPEQGVRFVLFSTSTDKLLIQGEAENPTAAANYAEALKHGPELKAYKIESPPQPVLPNGNAKFQIEGTKYGVN